MSSTSLSHSILGHITIESAPLSALPAITELCTAAFTRFEVFGPPWNCDAGVLPAVLAGAIGFSPNLSRIAVAEGQIVGHAQWTECSMRLRGKLQKVAYLAPLSVHPDWQRQGVGSLLMRDGIQLLRERDISLLFILGHDFYYPRFGLVTHCHGRHGLITPLPEAVAQEPAGWTLRPIRLGDQTALMALWQQFCGQVEGAIVPEEGILPWSAKTKGIIACILEYQGEMRAYARADMRPDSFADSRILRFLAKDRAAANFLLGRLKTWGKWSQPDVFIPLSLLDAGVQTLFPAARAHYQRWSAGMAMVLDGNVELASLLEAIRGEQATPLFIEWPNLFDW